MEHTEPSAEVLLRGPLGLPVTQERAAQDRAGGLLVRAARKGSRHMELEDLFGQSKAFFLSCLCHDFIFPILIDNLTSASMSSMMSSNLKGTLFSPFVPLDSHDPRFPVHPASGYGRSFSISLHHPTYCMVPYSTYGIHASHGTVLYGVT